MLNCRVSGIQKPLLVEPDDNKGRNLQVWRKVGRRKIPEPVQLDLNERKRVRARRLEIIEGKKESHGKSG